MRGVCYVIGSLSYVQETDREEDYAVQLIEVLSLSRGPGDNFIWEDIDRFCSCGWKFPHRFYARYLVVTRKPCVALQRVSKRDTSICINNDNNDKQCFIISFARRFRELLCF